MLHKKQKYSIEIFLFKSSFKFYLQLLLFLRQISKLKKKTFNQSILILLILLVVEGEGWERYV